MEDSENIKENTGKKIKQKKQNQKPNPEAVPGLNSLGKKRKRNLTYLKKIFTSFLLNVNPLEMLVFWQGQWQTSD